MTGPACAALAAGEAAATGLRERGAAADTAAERVDLLYRNYAFSLPSTFVMSLFVTAMLWGDLAAATLLPWLGALWLVSLGRWGLALRYRAARRRGAEAAGWRAAFVLGAALSGAVWGGGGALFIPRLEGFGQFFVILSLAGVAAVGAYWLAPVRHAALANVTAVLLPPAAVLLHLADPMHRSLGLLTLAYLVVLLLASYRTTAMIAALAGETRRSEELLRRVEEANRLLVLKLEQQRRDARQLERYRDRLHTLAFFDPLTGLPNRALFNDRLRQAMVEAARRGGRVGLLLLDLDHFKRVNDIFGHDTGDRLLCDAAQRLQRCLRGCDTIARPGADEFALLLPEVRQGADLGGVAHKLLAALAAPFWIDGEEVTVGASIGIALYPDDGDDGGQLYQYADAAMHHAKERGRNQFRFYSAELTRRCVERLSLEARLRRAEENGELELYYQPQIDLATGAAVGAEALLRWNHPERGVVTPDRFIGIAEDTGLIVEIGEWVLRRACLAVRRWNRRGERELRVAVNLSSRQFKGHDIVATVRRVLEESGCSPRWLELEITESLLLEDSDEVRVLLGGLRNLGVSIAIDDFGTGYSALAYLKRLPVDTVKIDRSFVRDIASDRDSAELTKGIISLARSLRLQLVAEGVENAAQQAFLQAYGCRLAQGYLFGRPVPVRQFEALLAGAATGRGPGGPAATA